MATIHDIAAAAGVSPSTVSRVMNHPDIVEHGTRQRVADAIAQLDYRPSRTARALRTQQFSSIAIAVGDSGNPFFARLTKAAQAVADDRDATIVVHDLGHSPRRLVDFLKHLPTWAVDGAVIVTGDDLAAMPGVLDLARISDRSVPLVLGQAHPGLSAVVSDHAASARSATNHLIEHGARQLLFVGRQVGNLVAELRWRGFDDARRAAGLRALDAVECALDYEAGYDATLDVIDDQTFDAVLAANDAAAIGAIRALHELGYRVPEDVAVMGFDGLPASRFHLPSLSTVATNVDRTGRELVEVLFRHLDDRDRPPEQVTIPFRLEIRESSASDAKRPRGTRSSGPLQRE